MGVTSSTAVTSARLPAGMNNLVGELGSDVQYDKSMGSSRFLRAIKARHRHGPLVVKTFLKPEINYSLRPLVRRLRVEREALADVPNVLAYQKVVETETAGYLTRQWVASNLYDRISTRPFLTIIEKKWITYQLLNAMREARRRKVPHGDLKTENVLVTTSLHIYITDFSSAFKQVFLPLNDPSDFNFYFGTSGRRTCYVAPERFYSDDSEIAKQKSKARAEAEQNAGRNPSAGGLIDDRVVDESPSLFKRDGKVTEVMDVFSLGCVIAELWRDGAPTFTLMQLFKYREGSYDIDPSLAEIADDDIREMVRSMLSLEPSSRGRFVEHLDRARGQVFPEIFYTFLHRYLTTLQRFSSQASALAAAEAAVAVPKTNPTNTANAAPSAASEATSAGNLAISDSGYIFRAEADERLERMYEEWAVVTGVLNGTTSTKNFSSDNFAFGGVDGIVPSRERMFTPFSEYEGHVTLSNSTDLAVQKVLPVQLCIPGVDAEMRRPDSTVQEEGPALLLLSPLLANLRNALRPSTKLHALEMLLHLSSQWLTDESKLDRVLPYMIALFSDESVMVRAAAVRSTVQLLIFVDLITFSNALTFPEYVMPNFRLLTRDPSPIVRSTYAACLVDLIDAGKKFLQMTSAMRAEGIFTHETAIDKTIEQTQPDQLLDGEPYPDEARYDRQLTSLRHFFQEQVTALVADPSVAVKRTLLANIEPLCNFFGSSVTNDILLSHMITYLNDRSWMLRHAFFDAIVDVSKIVGQRSFEAFILPLMLQSLSDPEEFVVYKVMESLLRLFGNIKEYSPSTALLTTAKSFDVVGAVAGFLCHPNHWLRMMASIIISAGSSRLASTDVWAVLYPSVRPLLRCDVHTIRGSNLLFAVKTPLSREVLQKAVQWANRTHSTSRFWKPPEKEAKGRAGLSNGLGREGIGLLAGRTGKEVTKTPIQRNEEDDAFLDNLRSSGLNEEDEVKLVGLREYIARLAKSSSLVGSSSSNARGLGGYLGARSNQEDDGLLPPLQIKSGLAVQSLHDVTPLTIFFSSKHGSIGVSSGGTEAGESVAPPASVRSQTAESSFSSRMAKRRLGGYRIVSDTAYVSPVEELRRRMNEATATSDDAVLALSATPGSDAALTSGMPSPSQRPTSPASITSVMNTHGQQQQAAQNRLGLGKALPAIASTSANATGTMSDLTARMEKLGRGHTRNIDASARSTPAGSVAQTIRGGQNDAGRGQYEDTVDTSTFTSTYEGQDPYIRAHLEAVYFANFRDKTPAWGPPVTSRTASGLRRRGGQGKSVSSNARAATPGSSNRRPEGNLIAYFTEHTGSITAIAISPDHAFFLSGSADGCIKVWDTARLEKNVTSKSRGTYTGQRGGITSLIMLEGSHCAASAAVDGSVHVIRVEVSGTSSTTTSLPKYGKIRLVSNFQLSNPKEHVTCMLQSSSKSGTPTREAATMHNHQAASTNSTGSGASTLLLATSKNRIIILDLRTMQVMTTFHIGNHLGSISTICLDPKNIWLLIGTIGGVMCLWDLRFQLLLKTWRIGRSDERGVLQVNSCILHPTRGKGKWVMISYERLNISFQGASRIAMGKAETLLETWDIDRTICVERFEAVRESAKSSGAKEGEEGSNEGVTQEATSLSESPDHNSGAQDEERIPIGLESAAKGIERLVKMMEYDEDHQPEGDGSDERTPRSNANGAHADVVPANVKVLLAGVEGYSSSAASQSVHVSGGWLDAARLAQQDGRNDEGDVAGPAGYLITAGQDRKIRFWDLGRAEKSCCLASKEERGDFTGIGRGDKDSANQKQVTPYRFVHQIPLSAGEAPSSSTITSKVHSRSPLLLHQRTSQINNIMKAHKDAITSLGVIESPFRCIVAGDQAGTIRVWE